MATYYRIVGVYWRFPDLTPVILEEMDPGPNNTARTYPSSISDDGKVIFGTAAPYFIPGIVYNSAPARWDLGVRTMLTPFTTIDGAAITGLATSSFDGSSVIGIPPMLASGLCRWDGTGAMTPTELRPPPNGIASGRVSGGAPYRYCSQTGGLVVALSTASGATMWNPVAPTALSSTSYESSGIGGCSADGSTIIGNTGSEPGSQTPTGYGYWRTSDLQFRRIPIQYYLRGVNANGTVIWSDTFISPGGGWTDNLDSFTGTTYPVYGTLHNYTAPAGITDQFMQAWAEDTFSPNPVAVSNARQGPLYVSTRSVGATTTVLANAGRNQTTVEGVSGNGQIVAGMVVNAAGTGWEPCWWDAAGAIHILAMPPGTWNDQRLMLGISRDGSTMFGSLSNYTPAPDPPDPPLALRMVGMEPQDLPANTFYLYSYPEDGNDFPTTFGQYSMSAWCCENVTIRWPQTDPARGLLTVTPGHLYAEFRSAAGVLLFSGNFINSGAQPKLYHIGFSINTEAGYVVCYGNNQAWLSTDATFHATGQIGNTL